MPDITKPFNSRNHSAEVIMIFGVDEIKSGMLILLGGT